MANNSVMQDRSGPDWPLGFVACATPRTPVNFMHYVDPSNNNSPNASPNFQTAGAEYTPRFHRITYQGYKPGNNTIAWVPNTGAVYVVRIGNNSAGGLGTALDTGVIVAIVQPGEGGSVPPQSEMDFGTLSPYRYFVDSDNAGDGLVLVGVGPA